MPITISHQPSMRVLAAAGYQAGLGQYRAQQQQMAMRERMQERALQANFLSQQMNLAGRAGLQQQGFQQQQRLLEQENEARVRFAQIQNQDAIDRIELQRQNARENLQIQQQGLLERDQTQFLLAEVDDVTKTIDGLLGQGHEFANPADAAKFEQGRNNIAKIMSDPTLTPMQRAQEAYKAAQSIPLPRQARTTIKDQWAEENHVFDDPITGQRIVASRTRTGWNNQVIDPKDEEAIEPTGITYEAFGKAFAQSPEKMIKSFSDLMTIDVPASTPDGKPSKKPPDPIDVMKKILEAEEFLRKRSKLKPDTNEISMDAPENWQDDEVIA